MPAPAQLDYVLAIDLGSGGPKVALVAQNGQVAAHASRAVETFVLDDGGVEQDPHQWWAAVSAAARQVLTERSVPIEQIKGVACTSQWSVTVPVDRQGQPLMRAVHWMDSRGAPYSRAITDGWLKFSGYGIRRLATWLRYTGGVPTHSGADVLAHLLFIKHQRPDVYRAADKFIEPMDYINARLTGRVAASHGTIFPYLLTDNRDNQRIDYAPRLLAFAGIDRAKLPDLLPVDAVLGPILPEVADAWGLSRSTQVVVGTSDSQAAVLGSGAVADYAPHLCIGTSSWLTCHVPFKRTDLVRNLATMPSAARGRNMLVAELGPAGKCLELLVNGWFFPAAAHRALGHQSDTATTTDPGADPAAAGQPIPAAASAGAADPYRQLEALAASVPAGSEGLLFLPWLNGSGPPTANPHARGGFFNQSLRTTRAHACRAALEGVAGNVRWLLGAVEHMLGRRVERLPFIGGGARIELWCQILADMLDRPILQADEPNLAIVRGAAMTAHRTLGRHELDDLAAHIRIARTFEPQAAHRAAYDELFHRLVTCYKSNSRLFRRWNTAPPRPRA